MTAKQYLSQLESMKYEIQILQERRQEFLDRATSITAHIDPAGGVQHSQPGDKVGNAVAAAADIARRIDEQTAELWEKEQQAIDQIRGLHNAKYIMLLYRVYVKHETIKEACYEMNISYKYGRMIHDQALAAFEERYADILVG